MNTREEWAKRPMVERKLAAQAWCDGVNYHAKVDNYFIYNTEVREIFALDLPDALQTEVAKDEALRIVKELVGQAGNGTESWMSVIENYTLPEGVAEEEIYLVFCDIFFGAMMSSDFLRLRSSGMDSKIAMSHAYERSMYLAKIIEMLDKAQSKGEDSVIKVKIRKDESAVKNSEPPKLSS